MGEQITPLFNKDALKEKKQTSFAFVSEESHHFFLLSSYREVKKILPSIENGKSYSLLSFGDWSLKELIMHIARIIGPCDVVSTTFGLGPKSSKGILRALEIGLFRSFEFLYDNKVREYKDESHHLCVSNFPVKITSIHAKITVLMNEQFAVMVTGSANWSDTNSKIEHAEVIVNREKAEFFFDVLKKAIAAKAVAPKELKIEIEN